MAPSVDVLFVYPPSGWSAAAMEIAENDAPPLGMLYVAAAARTAGMTVAALDLNHPGPNTGSVAATIASLAPRLLAVSCLTTAYSQAARLIRSVKRAFPTMPIVAGGVHGTVLPGDMLRAGADYVVLGEGEHTFQRVALALLDGKSPSDIPGIAYRPRSRPRSKASTAEPIFTSQIQQISDLDALTVPARDLVPIREYGQSGAICTTRGCTHACCFCSSVHGAGHKYRERRVDAVCDEIESLHEKYDLTHFQIVDDDFLANPERVERFAAAIAERGYVWSCQGTIMPLIERPDLLSRMFDAGCREVYFGMETGNRELFRRMKGVDIDHAIAVLRRASGLHDRDSRTREPRRLQTVVGFIIGHPEDDEESIEDTIEMALRLRKLRVHTMLSILQPYPGSQIHAYPKRFGITIESTNYSRYLYPVANISTRRLTRARIQQLYSNGLLRIMSTYAGGR